MKKQAQQVVNLTANTDKREKCDVRYQFKSSEKQDLFDKVGGICPRCGKSLKLGTKTCTVEHIIPLSRGGKNTKDNLILLCQECNLEKGNKIVYEGWYKFADSSLKESLRRLYSRYLENKKFMTSTNFFKYDVYSITTLIDVVNNSIYTMDVSKKCLREKKIEVQKATSDDIPLLVKAYRIFNKANNYAGDESYITNTLKNIMDKGIIWFAKDKTNQIFFVLPILLVSVEYGTGLKKEIFGSSKSKVRQPELTVLYPIITYRKPMYFSFLHDFLFKITEEFMDNLGVSDFPLTIEGCTDGIIHFCFDKMGFVQRDWVNDDNSFYSFSCYLSNSEDIRTEVTNDDYKDIVKLNNDALSKYGIKPIFRSTLENILSKIT